MAAVLIFMALLVVMPILVRLSESMGLESLAGIMAYIGFLWMGLLFLFVSTAFAIDVYRLIIYISEIITKKDLSLFSFTARSYFLLALLVSVAAAGYGWFEALNIRSEHVIIKTPKIPAEIGRLRIVQISDVHLGIIVREKRLQRILKALKAADPDIFVSTGDLVDAQMDHLADLARMLRGIQAKYGKYAVLGNHEFYAGLAKSIAFMEEAGFRILRNEAADVAGLIHIAGVDDPAGRSGGPSPVVPEKQLFSGLPVGKFTLFLKHQPRLDNSAIGLFDLQLSGHTHRGQIFPFSLVTRLFYPVNAGLLELQNGSYLYVSRGSGTWGPPIRFLSPPEVTVIDLVHQSRTEGG
ncbi:metallophosphoesterase [Thermodesulfobacteriota bacterium]